MKSSMPIQRKLEATDQPTLAEIRQDDRLDNVESVRGLVRNKFGF